jgi:type I restriction enzyme M protein
VVRRRFKPLSVIEQLTYLLFIKRLDELQTLKENKAARTGKPIEDPVFTADQDNLRWSRFKETAPEVMFETIRDQVFPFIKNIGNGSTYTHHMKDALFIFPSPRLLANIVDQLDAIDMTDSDTKGDLYEYMLGKIATAGQNGQFRTPRHIIKLMVEMTSPMPKDVICDPACGTAGFLIAASEYLRKHHGDEIYRDAKSRRRFNETTFHGYDFDSTMLRIGSMNMLLHGVENPDINYLDSMERMLTEIGEDDGETLLSDLLARSGAPSLIHFVRSLVAMDRKASKQIRFIEMIIDQLTIRGMMEPDDLYEAPFNSLDSGGPDALFTGHEQIIEGIFESLSTLNQTVSEYAG